MTIHVLYIQISGVIFCNAKLIKGCKQWYFGNALRNQYKRQFEIFFRPSKTEKIRLAKLNAMLHEPRSAENV